MKKSFFLKVVLSLMVLAFTASLAFSQANPTPVNENPTNQQIVDLLNMSLNANGAYTIEDINNGNLHVGDPFVFVRKSGLNVVFTTGLGDNPWTMGKKVLKFQNDNPNDPIVNSDQTKPVVPEEVIQEKKDPSFFTNSRDGRPWWLLWVALGITALLFIFGLIKKVIKNNKEKKEAAKNPVTSGIPMRRGGVNDRQAPAYAQQVAARQFNRPGLNVTNITRGRLSGENLEVYYGGQLTPSRRTFQNFLAYRGEVTVDGQQQFVYFLQGCGNDVRMGNYFSGQNISFVEEQVLQPATTDQPVVTEQQTTQPVNFAANLEQVAKFVKEVSGTADKGTVTMETLPNQVKVTWELSSSPILGTNHVDQQGAKEKVKEEQTSN